MQHIEAYEKDLKQNARFFRDWLQPLGERFDLTPLENAWAAVVAMMKDIIHRRFGAKIVEL